jgi:hypothetical protein
MNFPEQEKNNWLEKMHENITFLDDFIALSESRYTTVIFTEATVSSSTKSW